MKTYSVLIFLLFISYISRSQTCDQAIEPVCQCCLFPPDDPCCECWFGCTDPENCNYDPGAFIDDGSCASPGCTNSEACNYNSDACEDNGSCIVLDAGPDITLYYPQTDTTMSALPLPSGIDGVWGLISGTGSFSDPFSPISDISGLEIGSNEFRWFATNACNGNECSEDFMTIHVVFYGCTDLAACNYDPLANQNDGSCIYETDCSSDWCNDGAIFLWDTTSCQCEPILFPDFGCTDENACNYNSEADCNDGSCVYEVACDSDPCTNGGIYLWNDSSCSCELDVALLPGCTNMNSCNFNPMANCDDGSCDTNVQCDTDPCTNGGVYVYNPTVCDCQLLTPTNLGCDDPLACNYSADSNCNDGSCIYEETCDLEPCTNGGIYVWDQFTCSCVLSEPTIFGCTNIESCNYNPNANCDDGSCIIEDACLSDLCSDGVSLNWNPITCQCDTILVAEYGCLDILACNFDPNSNCDDNSCIYETLCDIDPCSDGGTYTWDPINCICVLDQITISGCTDAQACNYNLEANCSDNSCVYPGCTDNSAINFDATVGCDDGSCQFCDSFCYEVPEDILLWHRYDNDFLDSQGSNDGLESGGVIFNSGYVNESASFDGLDDLLTVSNPSDMNIVGELSFNFWFKTLDPNVDQTILIKGLDDGVGPNPLSYFAKIKTGEIVVGFEDDLGNKFELNSPSVTADDWHHVSYSRTNSDHLLFYDGMPVDADLYLTSNSSSLGYELTIGAESNGINNFNFFNGQLDELQIYNWSLNSTEVETIYNAGICGPCQENTECLGDANGDNMTNILDLVAVSSDFGCTLNCTSDVNGDGLVNFLDLVVVSSNFGINCQ